MVGATARFLEGKDFPLLGSPRAGWLRPFLVSANVLPDDARKWLYRMGSGRDALAADVVARLSAEDLASQVVDRYPPRSYPAALVGSTPGSAVHLCAALGAPLLPQTLLVPLRRRGVSPDDPQADVVASREAAAAMLEANPELVLHHMFDPNADRITLARFTYFRIKWIRLSLAYRRFLVRHLAPGAVILVSDCRHRWPVTTVGERHLFQFGGVGSTRRSCVRAATASPGSSNRRAPRAVHGSRQSPTGRRRRRSGASILSWATTSSASPAGTATRCAVSASSMPTT